MRIKRQALEGKRAMREPARLLSKGREGGKKEDGRGLPAWLSNNSIAIEVGLGEKEEKKRGNTVFAGPEMPDCAEEKRKKKEERGSSSRRVSPDIFLIYLLCFVKKKRRKKKERGEKQHQTATP